MIKLIKIFVAVMVFRLMAVSALAVTSLLITNQPASQTVLAGTNVTFDVEVSGMGPFNYQWQFDGTNLANNSSVITTVAGNYVIGDGNLATSAQLNSPSALETDASGNLYIADDNNNRIRKVDTNGVITTVAGNGIPGYSGDGGAATSASLSIPYGMVLDSSGNIYISDTGNNVIRKVDTNGIITTIAGDGSPGYTGDGGTATFGSLNYPGGIAVDSSGDLYIADRNNNVIREVAANGIITTVAGGVNPGTGDVGDGGPATSANLEYPSGVAVDTTGNLYIADRYDNRVRKVDTNGIITTVAGNGTAAFSGDGGAATEASMYGPIDVKVDASGNLYIVPAFDFRVRKVDTNGIITTVAGGGDYGDGSYATNASLDYPDCVAVDTTGELFIAEQQADNIRKVDTFGIISTVAGDGTGSYSGDGGTATNANFNRPQAVAVDASGDLFIADSANEVVREVGTNGIITTVAGNGTPGYSGDGGAATNATLNYPSSLVVDASGNLYIADFQNYVVRKVGTNGIITTVVGSGNFGYSGDGGLATNASLSYPSGLAVDALGDIFVCDQWSADVRKVDTNGIITTVAGNGNQGYSGDGGAATNASLDNPNGVAVDTSGNIYIVDLYNYFIRKVDTNGIITTFAGNGSQGNSGDGGPATSATMNFPSDVVADTSGNIYISDTGNNNVRKVDASGIITTVAGNGLLGYSGDGGVATNAALDYPVGIAVPVSGYLYIADSRNNLIREANFAGLPALVLNDVSFFDSGSYDVIVGNAYGSVTSSIATLTVLSPPIITLQPRNVAVPDGASALLDVGVTGTTPFSYQWQFNGGNLSNGTNGILLENGIGVTSAGSYDVVVTNLYGSVTSAIAIVSVGYAPTITNQPTSPTQITAGTNVTFSVGVSGTGPFDYQWQFDGVNFLNDIITTVAGGGIGDGGAATNARLDVSTGVAVDAAGNVYIADQFDYRIRKVGTNGIITSVVGNGIQGYSGDGGAATNANLNAPEEVAVDPYGNLFVADTYNNLIRKVDTNGIITTVAGNRNYGYSGDGGAATSATLSGPSGVAVDAFDNIYIADSGNQVIRKVDTSGIITTVAGNGFGAEYGFGGGGYSGDGGAATNATLDSPNSVAVDSSGNIFIADTANSAIRKVDTNGIISTVAGNGINSFSGDGGPATNASIYYPYGVAVGASGKIYIGDNANQRIRVVDASGIITTVAGGGPAFPGDGGAATNASLNYPSSIAVSASGNFYFVETGNSLVRKVTTNGIISLVAGIEAYLHLDDGSPATNSILFDPKGVAVDASGNIFIADFKSSLVRKVSPNGIISTVAGNGTTGYSGDGGAATNARLYYPSAVAVDAAGNLYIADYNNFAIRKVSATGIITTVAGSGNYGYSGDGNTATNAYLSQPTGVAVDGAGNIYIADFDNNVIRKVGTNGIITTVAGDGTANYSGDGGAANLATLNTPYGVGVDASGNLFIADSANNVIREVDSAGIITTVVGNGTTGALDDGGSPLIASLSYPVGVAVDASGNIFISDQGNQRIREVSNNTIQTVVGNGIVGNSGDGGPATSANMRTPTGLALDAAGNLFIADADNNRIREVNFAGEPTLVLTDVFSGNEGSYDVIISDPFGSVTSEIAIVSFGYAPTITNEPTSQSVSAIGSNVTFSVGVSGSGPFDYQWQFDGVNLANYIITTVAGNGIQADSGDGGAAITASLSNPEGVAVDASGNLYFSDSQANSIRKVGTNGIVTTVAGNGIGYTGDGGAATNATLFFTAGVAVDGSGNLYIADYQNDRIRKVDTNGIITTVAGNGAGSPSGGSYSGDGGAATNASLNFPSGVVVDASGNLFIADHQNNRIREVGVNGIITTVVGNGSQAYSGDGGAATNATLNLPYGVALDASGNLFIADLLNNRIRKVDATGIITTFAGNGSQSYSGDGGAATNASLNYPYGVAVDALGNVYIADNGNNVIRKVDTNGIITTVAGNGSQAYSGDGGAPTNASLNLPRSVAVDALGNLYISDSGNNRIREVNFAGDPTLVLTNVTSGDEGTYDVIISDLYGSVTSAPVTLNIGAVVTTTADSGSSSLRGLVASVAPGSTITFDPSLSGQTILLTSGPLMLTNNITINGSTLTNGIQINGNHSSRVFFVSNATVVLTSLTITNGYASSLDSANIGGGGIYNAGTLTVNNCTLAGNSSTGGGGGIGSRGPLTVNQCTITGNTAVGGGGIGIYYFSGGILTVNQSTLTGNIATGSGPVGVGGDIFDYVSAVTNFNSIASDVNINQGTLTLLGTNLIQTYAVFGSSTATNPAPITNAPLLSVLGYYGGPTPTMPPLSGSPVINTGSDSATNLFLTDQRGFPRLAGLHVDIGAVEFIGCPNPPVITFNGASVTNIQCSKSSIYVDPGIIASDSCGFTITATTTGHVFMSAGAYILTYVATDPNGNSTTTNRTVNVLDTIPPVVTLSGSANITLTAGSSFTDPGATANDSCAGILPVGTFGNLNVNLPGVYVLNYFASDPSGNSASVNRTITVNAVGGPPVITVNPTNHLNVTLGSTVTFLVTATATGATNLTYQWLLNGVAISGATNTSFVITNVQATNSGAYSVAVSDDSGSVESSTADLTVNLPVITGNDNFANASALTNSLTNGVIRSINVGATRETGETNIIAGNPGGASIWFKWKPTSSGVVTFSTLGCDFETLLGVYIGTSVSALQIAPSSINVGDNGPYLSSTITFNAIAGTNYDIVVDGYYGATGNVVLSWSELVTTNVVPTVTVVPPPQTVVSNNSALTLTVQAANVTNITWFFNGQATTNHTTNLPIVAVTAATVGNYFAQITGSGGTIVTPVSSIQYNILGDGTTDTNSFAWFKFLDSVNNPVTSTGGTNALIVKDVLTKGGSHPPPLGGGDSSGFAIAQTFSTVGSTSEPGEPIGCGPAGAAPAWYTYITTKAGTLEIDTAGSSFNTKLAVYIGPGNSFTTLTNVGCEYTTNRAQYKPEVYIPNVPTHQTNYIQVEGISGSSGTVQLNIHFGDPAVVTAPPTNQLVALGSNATFTVAATGSTPLYYTWQFNGTNITAATNNTLTVTNSQLANSGLYTVTVSNLLSVSSASAALGFSPPAITNQPVSHTVTTNTTATLTVGATGSPAPAFQWYYQGTPVGANNSTLTLPAFGANNQGSYDVVVSNPFGSVTSLNATLLLNAPLRLGVSTLNATGTFQFQIIGNAGSNYVVQTSTNLIQWIPYQTNSDPNGLINFIYTNQYDVHARFFRAMTN